MKATRPKTLWAAASPVLIGWALAAGYGVFHPPAALLAMVGALLIQVATNYHNDYADFLKGTDKPDRAGPKRVTAAGLATPEQMRRATVLAFSLAVLSGVYLMVRGGLPIVAIGVLSILFGVMYTAGSKSLAYLGIADFFVLVFFGPVAVGGTYWVQALQIHPEVLWAGLAPGLLSMAILLVNNIRDVDEDRAAGKRTLVVRAGRSFGVTLWAVCVVGAAFTPIAMWLLGVGSGLSLLAPLILMPALPLYLRLRQPGPPASLNPVLAGTARLLLFYAVLFSVGWLIPLIIA
ncbi:MAG: 1,4-dihydroxy-2-naphthoate polyprenyltransferase [Rhodothermales bacterium]|nr:1,4-dihydroxy-2-naphthoate polyprenyltransferase [Rhodothermales bacterium]MBO6779608.1 1,4-dihydroxy-2-naphthoate polyprenyltransferase [Rhodothermales bacterium]